MRAGSIEFYNFHYKTCKLKNELLIERVVARILRNKNIYKLVEAEIKFPWQAIGCIHFRESNLSFHGCLHNGDPLNAPTVNVPKGRGPFDSWEQSAIDALTLEGFASTTKWSLELILTSLEMYNGFGYMKKNLMSPYLWSFTDKYSHGKYVKDGKYDPEATDAQVGCAAILKKLEMMGQFKPTYDFTGIP